MKIFKFIFKTARKKKRKNSKKSFKFFVLQIEAFQNLNMTLATLDIEKENGKTSEKY